MYKYFSGAGKVYINTFQASPVPERYQINLYIEILMRRRRSIFTHFFGAGEVFIYTYLALKEPEKLDKPEKHLYTPNETIKILIAINKFRMLITDLWPLDTG